MLARPARLAIYTAIAALLLLIVGGFAAELYTEALWFDRLGYASVLWTHIGTALLVRSATAAAGAIIIAANLYFVVRGLGPMQVRRRYGNLEIAEQVPRRYVSIGIAAVSVLGGWWLSGLVFGGSAAMSVLAWIRSVPWGLADPYFERDVSFFVFSLPVLSRLIEYLLLVIGWGLLLAFIGYVLIGAVRWRENRVETDEQPRLHFAIGIAAVVLVLAIRYWLGRYDILLEGTGFSAGVGYTDIHARLPARRVLAVLSVAAAGALAFGAVRRTWWPPVVAVGALLVAAIGLGYVYPAVIQRLRVEPNELEREREYIAWNIEFTRRAYRLEGIRSATYDPAGTLADQMPEPAYLELLPLWDPEPLAANFNQTQTVREYLYFPRVHFDRYGPPDERRQVAVAVREFRREGLPPDRQTWRTLHLDPTTVRGWGAVVANVAEKTTDSKPSYWLHLMNPIRLEPTAPRGLELTEPSVFYGELPQDYLVIGASIDTAAAGPAVVGANGPPVRNARLDGGIRLDSFFKLLAFAWRFSDYNLLFSGELTDSSRILIHRRVIDRVQRLAPFVVWDPALHPVVAGGRIMWIVNGYTVTPNFPLARAERILQRGPFRYINDGVKATVDALTGDVAFYVVDESDPVLKTYARIFPDLLRPFSAMPPELAQHLVYPEEFLQVQARLLQEYHVQEPDLFFSGQDLWQVPDDPGAAAGTAPYRPVPLFAAVPGEPGLAFSTVMPFNARQRQNMTALLMVRNDPERYGEMLLLEFPPERQVRGPRQIQALIEQEPIIARELALLREQRNTIQPGRLRIVPLDNALLYILPMFISSDISQIPQLEYVAVTDGATVRMEETLPSAIAGLYGGTVATDGDRTGTTDVQVPVTAGAGWAARAAELARMAEDALRAGDWAGFGRHWADLRDLLARVARDSVR